MRHKKVFSAFSRILRPRAVCASGTASLRETGFILLLLLAACTPPPVAAPLSIPVTASTQTESATFTPIPTPTITPTPLPPAVLAPCPQQADCPDALDAGVLAGEDVTEGEEQVLEITADQQLVFRAAWVALDDAYLQQNIPYLQYFFEIDGNSYFNPSFLSQVQAPERVNPMILHPALALGVVTSDWRPGETHRVRLGITVTADINDGFENTLPGTTKEFLYLVTVQ